MGTGPPRRRRAEPALERSLAYFDALAGTPWGNLVVARRDDEARAEAAVAAGPLEGLVAAVKDNIDVASLPTRLGSDASDDRPAGVDAAVVAAVRRVGAVIAAKTHLHELGAGVSGLVGRDGPARHPLDPERITGGSSSGAAALVALGAADFALGTDTGASVRAPAALCGCVGFVPRQDRLPRHGVTPLNPTLDRVGVLARDLRTMRRVWTALADPPVPLDRPLRIGVVATGAEPAVALGVAAAARALDARHEVTQLRFGRADELRSIYRVVSAFEFARLVDGQGERAALLQPELRTLLDATRFPGEGEYAEALVALASARTTVAEELGVDVLLLSTVPVTAPRAAGVDRAVHARLLADCTPFSVLDWPALSIPAPGPGLPVGVQLVGVRIDEAELLAVAALLPGGVPEVVS
ncbi:amidase family protein [Jiangella anatolica]|uniref:Amidase n=1 Tax=Jiangella anatolica TaxID=2670374 RepID=A0A2W2B4P4_9ACTN|nr:amidase [Jiangella anatolica]PZF82355.1 amidase [Jiangella anatolica]